MEPQDVVPEPVVEIPERAELPEMPEMPTEAVVVAGLPVEVVVPDASVIATLEEELGAIEAELEALDATHP